MHNNKTIALKKENVSHKARRNMRFAIYSACWGAIVQVMVNSSGIIVIFAALIGASEMTAVMSTALLDSAVCLLMLPFAALSDRIGVRRQISSAVYIGAAALLVSICAAWTHEWASVVLISALAVFAVAMSAYTAAWFPLVEQIVPLSERGLFFGRMRFSWQSISTIFILASGWFIGRYATIERIQIIIILAAFLSLGRAFYVNRIVLEPIEKQPPRRLSATIRDAVANRSLTGFSVYLFFLYIAAYATIPLIIVFARNHLRLADSLIVTLSAVSMGGLIFGYLIGGRLVQRYGVKFLLLVTHIGFALLNFSLLTIHSDSSIDVIKLAVILIVYGILLASASIAVSSELLTLASPTNKAVSIAFGYSLYSAGRGGSRFIASLVLGSGILATEWQIGTQTFTHYHSLFLASAIGVFLAMTLLVFVPALTRDVKRLPSL